VLLTLSACPPFSLRAIIGSHGWVQLAPFAADPQATLLTRVERLESGRVVELHIREARGGVAVEVRDSLTGAEREEVSRKVWWMLGLGEDLSPFYTLARQEPHLAHVEPQALGRILRSPTLFEDAVKVILTTNTAWSGTQRMVEALVTRYGDPLPTNPARNAFPTPAQIAASDEETLRTIGLGYRAPSILSLARRVAEGSLDLEALKRDSLPTPEIHRRLLAIPGIGHYAAACLLMLIGRYDHLPVDSNAYRMVSQEWYGGRPVSRSEIEAQFEHWGDWKGLAYWFWAWSRED